MEQIGVVIISTIELNKEFGDESAQYIQGIGYTDTIGNTISDDRDSFTFHFDYDKVLWENAIDRNQALPLPSETLYLSLQTHGFGYQRPALSNPVDRCITTVLSFDGLLPTYSTCIQSNGLTGTLPRVHLNQLFLTYTGTEADSVSVPFEIRYPTDQFHPFRIFQNHVAWTIRYSKSMSEGLASNTKMPSETADRSYPNSYLRFGIYRKKC